MLEIGEIAGNRRGEGSTIKGIVEGLKHNKVFVIGLSGDYLNLPTTNHTKYFDTFCYARWRVIGFALSWAGASTANEDPIVEFGNTVDGTAYGKMTSAITGGEKFCASDIIKYDPLNLLVPEVITEASATMVITWTEGTKFNVWQTVARTLTCSEAAVAGMTSGVVRPCVVIEMDTGGKW